MLRLATLGTSWITEQFIQACQAEGSYILSKVHSRSLDKAQAIVEKFGQGQAVDQVEALFEDDVDVVYIASPNSLHYSYAIQAIEAGKHVIVEKPQFANLEEWESAHALASEKAVYLFEAIRTIHTKNYKLLKSFFDRKLTALEAYPFLGAAFNFGQYSSRYDKYLDAMANHQPGPNVFNPEFAGGTLMDLGVYPIYVALGLFGMPEEVNYQPMKGKNGIDLMGTISLTYDSFEVSVFVSKAVHSIKPSEIYLGNETIVIDSISDINQVDLINRQSQLLQTYQYPEVLPLFDEVRAFANIIQDRQSDYTYEELERMSYQVTQIMEALRDSAGLHFPKSNN